MTPATWAETSEARILINLFADHTAEEMNTAEGQRLIAVEFQFPVAEYSDRVQLPALREPFVKLVKIRNRVDLIANNFPNNPEAQFRKAAALLKKYRKQNAIPEMRIARRFIECALAPGWNNPDLRARCATISEFFEKYTDYFLSYTNKQADQTNTDFTKTFYPNTKALLRTCKMTANLLARQIIVHLSDLSGFYDKEQIELGDMIRAEIVRGANSALVFLQVVSRVMLTSQDEAQNWCFQEYVAYKNDNLSACSLARERARLFIFLIAERPVQGSRPAEAVRPFAELRDAYKPWHNDMLELATMTLERSSPEKLKEQIEAIAQQIHKFRHSVLDTVVCDEFAADLAY